MNIEWSSKTLRTVHMRSYFTLDNHNSLGKTLPTIRQNPFTVKICAAQHFCFIPPVSYY